jgi:hypothetical protein
MVDTVYVDMTLKQNTAKVLAATALRMRPGWQVPEPKNWNP